MSRNITTFYEQTPPTTLNIEDIVEEEQTNEEEMDKWDKEFFEHQIELRVKKKEEEKKEKAKKAKEKKKKAEEDFENEAIDDILHTFKKYNPAMEDRDEYIKGKTNPIRFNEKTIKRLRQKPYSFSLLQIKKIMREIAASTNWTFLRHLIGEDLVNNPSYIRCPYKLCNGDNRFITYKKAQNIHLFEEFNSRYFSNSTSEQL